MADPEWSHRSGFGRPMINSATSDASGRRGHPRGPLRATSQDDGEYGSRYTGKSPPHPSRARIHPAIFKLCHTVVDTVS